MTINLSSDDDYYLSDKLVNNLNKMFKHISSKEGLEDNNVNLRFISSKEMKELNVPFGFKLNGFMTTKPKNW